MDIFLHNFYFLVKINSMSIFSLFSSISKIHIPLKLKYSKIEFIKS